jgi:hypothetical protein
MRGRWRAVGGSVALLAGLGWAWSELLPSGRAWALWPVLLTNAALCALFVLACYASGLAVVTRLTPGGTRDGSGPVAFALGVLLFGVAVGVGGLCDMLGPTFFWVLPTAMIAVGVRPLAKQVAALPETFGRALDMRRTELVLWGVGVVCLCLLYPQVLNPDNLNYDARWYHLRAAERYALAGAQVRTPEGDYLLTLPQLSSWLYTWAFLAPSQALQEHVRLSLHVELATVLGTLAGIPALARALDPELSRGASRVAWVALFFSPSIFVYDTAVLGGADHIAALWSAPVLLTWLQARARRDLQSWALFGLLLGGVIAKYTAMFWVAPVVVAVAIDWGLNLGLRRLVVRVWGPLVAAGAGLAVTSVYWARNWVWYHNPIYPMGGKVFGNTPWSVDAEYHLHRFSTENTFVTPGTAGNKLREAARALGTYWTELYTWGDFVGFQPAFGFAFAVMVLSLPFLPRARRLWLAVGLIHVGVLLWFLVNHQMRYLTVLVPVMAAVISCIAWRWWSDQSVLPKVAVLGVAVLQVAAFGDVPLRRTHRMNGHRSPLEAGLDYLAEGTPNPPRQDSWRELAAPLPEHALVLVHGNWPVLGFPRQTMTDTTGLQFGINYGRWGSVTQTVRELRRMGATHIAWTAQSEQLDSVAGEAILWGTVAATIKRSGVGAWSVGELAAPTAEPSDRLLYVGCGAAYPTGLYALAALAEPIPTRWAAWPQVTPLRASSDWHALLDEAQYLVIEDGCGDTTAPMGFSAMGQQGGGPRLLRYFVRQHP